jgi:anti-sigma B factor antagonist
VHAAGAAGADRMHDDDDFRVGRRLEGGVAVVVPEGDIDLRTAEAVRTELQAAQAEARRVVLDLRQVTFMDSSGIRLLVEAQHAADRDSFSFAVVPGPRPVQRLLELAGLTGRLALVDDPADAG